MSTEPPQAVDLVVSRFLITARETLHQAIDPITPAEQFKPLISVATLSAMVAYLLTELHSCDGGHGTDAAWTIHDWAADGEPAADFVREEIDRRRTSPWHGIAYALHAAEVLHAESSTS